MEIMDGFVVVSDNDDDNQCGYFDWNRFDFEHRMICVRRLFNYSIVNLSGNESRSNKAVQESIWRILVDLSQPFIIDI